MNVFSYCASTYECPLSILSRHQNIGDAIIDLCHVHSIHQTHRTMVQRVTKPAPVDELGNKSRAKEDKYEASSFHN
jgi:hypothetical protein